MRSSELITVVDVTSYAYTEKPGGVKDYSLGLQKALRNEGFAGYTIAAKPRPGISMADYHLGIEIPFSVNGTEFNLAFGLNKRRARGILQEIRPDIINLQEPPVPFNPHTIISAAPRRRDGRFVPCIIGTYHSQQIESLRTKAFAITLRELTKAIRRPRFKWGMLNGVTDGYYKTVMGSQVGRIAVSEATAHWVERVHCDNFPYRIIHNGIDTDRFISDGPLIKEWQDDKKTILYSGRLDERKGVEYLIRAVGLLKQNGRAEDIKIKIGGQGGQEENIRALVMELGLVDMVEFIGFLSSEKYIEALRTADLCVCPAYKGEGFGRVLIEAQSCGTPAVVSRISGFIEAAGESPAVTLVNPEDPDDLAKGIRNILDLSPEKRREIGMEGRKYVASHYDWGIIGKQAALYYRECLDKYGWPQDEDWPERRKRRRLLFH